MARWPRAGSGRVSLRPGLRCGEHRCRRQTFRLLLDGERRLERLLQATALVRTGVCAYLVLSLIILQAERAYEFIYFQF